jgi:hypothetical protein
MIPGGQRSGPNSEQTGRMSSDTRSQPAPTRVGLSRSGSGTTLSRRRRHIGAAQRSVLRGAVGEELARSPNLCARAAPAITAQTAVDRDSRFAGRRVRCPSSRPGSLSTRGSRPRFLVLGRPVSPHRHHAVDSCSWSDGLSSPATGETSGSRPPPGSRSQGDAPVDRAQRRPGLVELGRGAVAQCSPARPVP